MSYRINLATPHISEEGYELEYVNDAFSKTGSRRWVKTSINSKRQFALIREPNTQ
jgi:hypothetical protein